jgi:hypothetical protein
LRETTLRGHAPQRGIRASRPAMISFALLAVLLAGNLAEKPGWEAA